MGVYVKDIEMPQNCYFCWLGRKCPKYEALLWNEINKERKADCPLIFIPSHGRVIDADMLTISTAVPLDGKPYQYVHIDNIKDAPTIIPVEEGK